MKMKIEYLGPFSDTDLVGFGNVKRGDEIEVSDEIAEALIARHPSSWRAPEKKKPKKREVKKDDNGNGI